MSEGIKSPAQSDEAVFSALEASYQATLQPVGLIYSMDCVFSACSELDLEEIRERCRNTVTFPEAAPLREAFGTSIRVIPFNHDLVFYMPP